MIRQPIICVLGHVDHGKTLLLDKIRGTLIQKKEAGGITQHIGATEVPLDVIKRLCGPLLEKFGAEIKIPGLLFIDTPGHEAFTSLRRRGGSIADLAVLVIDINEGVMPQTKESIEILKQNKVPFVVAANKIDLIPGWRPKEDFCFLDSLKEQGETARRELDERIYRLMSQLSEMGFDSDRFDRVDFQRQIAIIPTSAVTGEGISELLAVLAGLSQKYLEDSLKIEVKGPGRGNVIEVKEEKGLGKTIDVILYEGSLKVGDRIAVGALPEPIITRIKAILKPRPLRELREKGKFESVREVHAACGIKIVAPNLEGVIPGMPLVKAEGEVELEELKKDIQEVIFSKEINGVIIKADTLGGLEALTHMMRNKGIPVRKAEIGEIGRSDVMEAKSVKEFDPFLGVIFGFNVKVNPLAEEAAKDLGIGIITSNIIYEILDRYEEWVKEERERKLREELKDLSPPGKFTVLPGFVFRQSKPAIVGVEVLAGKIKPGCEVMKLSGKRIGKIKQIQDSGVNVEEAKKGDRVAVSIDGAVIGRNLREGEVLLVDLSKKEIEKWTKHKNLLSKEEQELLEEIAKLKAR
ncbi:translation initiation factor IF-2 [Nanoarchaeota archaeon]|nr:MAG: translation initiation factor IF-2 [Nanoarchaeota archaeon]